MSFRGYFVLSVFLASIYLVNAASRVDVKARLRAALEKHEAQASLKRSSMDQPSIRELLGLEDGTDLTEVDEMETVQGTRVAKMKETYQGTEVFDEFITIETDKSGSTTLDASGTLLENIGKDLENKVPRLSGQDALDIALNASGDDQYRNNLLSVTTNFRLFPDDNGEVYPAYWVQYVVETEEVTKRPTFIIDAETGDIRRQWDALSTCRPDVQLYGGNEKIGKIKYGRYPWILELTRKGDVCLLENEDVRVINNNYTKFTNISQTASFDCSSDIGDQINGAYSPALDALFYGTITASMFREWYGMTPLESQVHLRVHYGRYYQNAFWNGFTVAFGDGNGWLVHPLVSLDLVAHEIAHGVVERFSGLLYFNQSGGMNEAFADITAETVEGFFDKPDWKIADDITIAIRPFRFFEDPTLDRRSISHFANYTVNMPPHYSSGIYNHAFYLLVKKFSLSIKDAYAVFLHANRFYWHAVSDFQSGVCDLLKAAYDLGQPTEKFAEAFAMVGLSPCDLENHVRSLKINKTLNDIKVSETINPFFKFSAPRWTERILVEAVSEGDVGTVHVSILTVDSINGNKRENVLAQGESPLEYDIPRREKFKVLIHLSSDSKQAHNTSVTVTSFCDMDFYNSTENIRHDIHRFEYFHWCKPWIDLRW